MMTLTPTRKPTTTQTSGTEIVLGESKGDKAIATAIGAYLKYMAAAQAALNCTDKPKEKIRAWAEARWLELYNHHGAPPSRPFAIVTASGKRVLFIVQDGTNGLVLQESLQSSLEDLIGPEQLESITQPKVLVSLNQDVMAEPAPGAAPGDTITVGDLVAAELNTLRIDMANRGILTAAQAEAVFEIEPVRVIRPKLLERLPSLAKAAKQNLSALVFALGKSVKRFVQK